MAVSIDPEGSVVFKGKDQGKDIKLALPRAGDPDDMTYTLAFVNEPPSFAVPDHDEFPLYYEILHKSGREIPSGDRFKLEFDLQHERLDEVPCMPTEINP